MGSPEPLQSLDSLISPLFPLACPRLPPSPGKLTMVIPLPASNWPPSLTATKKKVLLDEGQIGLSVDARAENAGGRRLNQSLQGSSLRAETMPPVIGTLPVNVAKLDSVMLNRN